MPIIYILGGIAGLFLAIDAFKEWGEAAEKTGKYVLLPAALVYAGITILSYAKSKQ